MYELSERVISMFLWGTETPPEDLASPDRIRPHDATGQVDIDVDDYMDTGAGRFASAANFSLIQFFFADATLEPGTYSEGDLKTLYGVSNSHLSVDQRAVADGTDDWIERTLIFAHHSYKISDDAVFVVNGDGSKEIQNFAIEPLDGENFDFEGTGIAEQIGNPILKAWIDPSGIGRTVDLHFTGAVTESTYTAASYLSDQAVTAGWTDKSLDIAGLYFGIHALSDHLWDAGITRFVDVDGRPIVYMDYDGGSVDYSPIYANEHMRALAGAGFDVVGSPNSDDIAYAPEHSVLFGGDGADTFEGFNKYVSADGGNGSDTFQIGEQIDVGAKGGSGDDTFNVTITDRTDREFGGVGIVGGDGSDTINIVDAGTANLPSGLMAWGGAGNDHYVISNAGYTTRIEIEHVTGLTDDNVPYIGGPIGIANPDDGDTLSLNGYLLGTATYQATLHSWFDDNGLRYDPYFDTSGHSTLEIYDGDDRIARLTGFKNGDFGMEVTGGDIPPGFLDGDTNTFSLPGGTVVPGTPDDDVLSGTDTDEVFTASAGNDVIAAGGGNDLFLAAAGDGNDDLDGGDGYDTADYSTDTAGVVAILDDSVAAGSVTGTATGSDALHSVEAFIGGSGGDDISGTDGSNYLAAGDGNDTLDGGAGDDELDAGNGDDELTGGTGDDYLNGGFGDDVYDYARGDGHDSIAESSGGGSDTLTFTDVEGADISFVVSGQYDLTILVASIAPEGEGSIYVSDGLRFGSGVELVSGGLFDPLSRTDILATVAVSGNVEVDGTAEDDTLLGIDGNQEFLGFDGDDFLDGGAGEDEFDGGDGYDTVAYGLATAGIVLDLENGDNNGGDAAGDTFISVEHIVGSSLGDTIVASMETHDIEGVEGDDTLIGSAGDDTLIGGAGNDTLEGSVGSDSYSYSQGDGEDTIVEGAGAGVDELQLATFQGTGFFSSGYDLIIKLGYGTSDASDDGLVTILDGLKSGAGYGIEVFTDGVTTLSKQDIIDQITGSAQADVSGSVAGDFLIGGSGDQALNGLDGDDTIDGGAGADTIDGGDGTDLASYASADGSVYVDMIAPENNLGDALGDTFSSIEGLAGSAFDDVLIADSNVQTITGGGGNDSLFGGTAASLLVGDAGEDIIVGGSAADTIDGGAGDDSLTGGSGDDIFVFRPGLGDDGIVDFQVHNGTAAGDVIEIHDHGGMDFTSLMADAAQSGSDVALDLGDGNSIMLYGISIADLASDDFRFV